jgi:hypothetical protein
VAITVTSIFGGLIVVLLVSIAACFVHHQRKAVTASPQTERGVVIDPSALDTLITTNDDSLSCGGTVATPANAISTMGDSAIWTSLVDD